MQCRCKKCGQVKSLDDFYDSNVTTCKTCVCEAVRENRKAKAEYYKAFDKVRAKLPHRVEAKKKYSLTPRGKEVHLKANKRFRENNPEKYEAHMAVTVAVASGKLVKPDACQDCGAAVPLQAHHEDYSKPLDVMWLCSSCHAKHHYSEDMQHAAAV